MGGRWGRNKKKECGSKMGEECGSKVGKDKCGRKVKEEPVDS
jgi:hypothetical protein